MFVYSFCGLVVRAFSHSSNYLSTSYGPKIEKKIHLQKITQLQPDYMADTHKQVNVLFYGDTSYTKARNHFLLPVNSNYLNISLPRFCQINKIN
jgi:hypothetical protein